MTSPRGRTAGHRRRPDRCRRPDRGLLRPASGRLPARAAGQLRHVRASRLVAATTFNEDHIVATSQAIVEYRAAQGIDGPLYLGADTHALSEPATRSALEVFAANEVSVLVDSRGGYTPTPAVSRAILAYNHGPDRAPGRRRGGHPVAQPAGRRRLQVQPAGRWPGRHRHHRLDPGPGQRTAGRRAAPRSSGSRTSRRSGREYVQGFDFLDNYVAALAGVLDLDAIASAGVRIGADPLGGASVAYWAEIGSRYGLDLTVVNPDRRPAVRLHDAGLGRQDPDGLLVAVGDGLADHSGSTTSTSRPATTPTPTGTASSRPTPG